MNARTFQFIPGNNPSMVQTAQLLGADAVIIDLEDSVSVNEKDSARNLVFSHIQNMDKNGCLVGVRINPTDTPYWKEDVLKLNDADLDFILLPKASVEAVNDLAKIVNKDKNIIVLIESAAGIVDIKNILSAHKNIVGALFGAEDYAADMAIVRTAEGREIEWARNQFVINCVAQQKLAIDTPFTASDDFVNLRKDTMYAKAIGFKSKSSINPRHLDLIHEVFNPTKEEYLEAKEILELNDKYESEGIGVFSYKGKMVDLPIVKRCKNVVDICEKRKLY